MASARERGRCRERLQQLSESGLDCHSLRREAVADLQRVIGFDRWCWPLADPQTLARKMVVDLIHPGAGPIKALGVPVKLSDTPGAVDKAAPILGQDTAAILVELGYTEAERRDLEARGIVQVWKTGMG